MVVLNKISDFLNRFLRNTNLNAKRILRLYTYILFFIPLAFAALLYLRSAMTKQPFALMIKLNPMVSVAVITAFVDFLLGYYLWISKSAILLNKNSYRFFMICQAISQLLVGNFVCLIFALFGIFQAKNLAVASETNSKRDNLMEIISVCILLLFIICFILLMLIEFRKSQRFNDV